jgi:hypothetical protein
VLHCQVQLPQMFQLPANSAKVLKDNLKLLRIDIIYEPDHIHEAFDIARLVVFAVAKTCLFGLSKFQLSAIAVNVILLYCWQMPWYIIRETILFFGTLMRTKLLLEHVNECGSENHDY